MFIDKAVSLIFGIIFLFVLSCDGPSAESVAENAAVVEKNKPLQNDPVFWDYAASSNMLQTEVGELAAEKGGTDSIKALGEKTVSFHSKAMQQLRSLVSKYENIHLPDSLGSADKDLVQEFKLLEGEAFNTRYRDFIVNSHRMQLELYQEALSRAEDKKTRDWLRAMLMHLRKELETVASADSSVQQ